MLLPRSFLSASTAPGAASAAPGTHPEGVKICSSGLGDDEEQLTLPSFRLADLYPPVTVGSRNMNGCPRDLDGIWTGSSRYIPGPLTFFSGDVRSSPGGGRRFPVM